MMAAAPVNAIPVVDVPIEVPQDGVRSWIDEEFGSSSDSLSGDPIPNFPSELKEIPHWILWKLESRGSDGDTTKIPYQIDGRTPAKSNDRSTWSSFSDAAKQAQAINERGGLGFELGIEGCGFVALDLDACLDSKRKVLAPWANEFLKKFPTYVEITPSGNGLRAIYRGKLTLPNGKFVWTSKPLPGLDWLTTYKTPQAEVFVSHKYITVTGNTPGDPQPIADLPDGWFTELERLGGKSKSSKSAGSSPADTTPIPKGQRNTILWSMAGRMRWAGLNNDEILTALRRINRERCVPPKSDDELRDLANRAGKYPEPDVAQSSATLIDEPTAPRPKLSDDALYGLAGEIVRKLIPETEAHPAALLAETLVRFGNIIGRTSYYEVEDTQHFANIFIVKVGLSSKSRKDTAGNRIMPIFAGIDDRSQIWARDRVFGGLVSGEGVIWNVRDMTYDEKGNPKPGITDKRMFVYESEFASDLQVMKREGNTLSSVIRLAWDGKILQIASKNSPVKATGSHISISGGITMFELRELLAKADAFNGFANRFLWLHLERGSLKPDGGKKLDWMEERIRLKSAIEFAKGHKRIFMDRNAREMWHRIYEKLSEEHPGLFGAVTSRAEGQVIRLALIYALLDESENIRSEHLKAALAFWQYCEDSARFIFGGLTPEQRKILQFLANGPKSRSQIHQICFQGHRKADLIAADLAALIQANKIARSMENQTEVFSLVQ